MKLPARAIRSTVVAMRALRLTAVLLSVGLLGSPISALYCNDVDAAAMACCQGDMSKCNQPGKTEDCCRKIPASQETAGIATKADRIDRLPLAGPLHVAVLSAAENLHASSAGLALPWRPLELPRDAWPPRNVVLRI